MSDTGQIFEQIQSICDEFRRQLRKGANPRIEACIEQVPETARPVLFQQLLSAEVTYRMKRGASPTADEYEKRFPKYAGLVRRNLHESSATSISNDQPSTGCEATFITEVPVGEQIGEYELIRELGRGAFGVVFEARHVRRKDRAALKTLKFAERYDADRLHRFRHEFRRLAATNDPNLVGMQTLEFAEDRGQWFFTMDLVQGTHFLEYVRPEGRLNEKRLREALAQLVSGISTLHARQIVHRDLKPSNVMVEESGRVIILDFGLVAELQQRMDDTVSMRSGEFAGTLRYAAPEQLDGRRLAATDWYAVGVMIYEALTGEAPFQGNMADLMVQKRTLDAPKLSGRPDLPKDLSALVDQLLSRQPDERPDESAILSSLSGVESDAALSPSDVVLSKPESETYRLIGREVQFQELKSAHHRWLTEDKPLVLFITGRSGEGKTSLIEQFLEPIRRDANTLVLSGRCYDRESVPFKAIDGLIDAIVNHLIRVPQDSISELLPDDILLLAHLFPILRRVPQIHRMCDARERDVARLDPKQRRQRAFVALKNLLCRISTTSRITLFIDDLQWGDAESAHVLMNLLSPPAAPPVLLLGSYRSDESHDSIFLQNWSTYRADSELALDQTEVEVGPLSPEQCIELVSARIRRKGRSVQKLAIELHGSTGGNPYLIEQSIEYLDGQTGSASLNEVIANRLARLPAQASILLDMVAVAGQSLPLNEVSVAARCENAFETLIKMSNERLIRCIGSDQHPHFDTYHDRIRETVLGQLVDVRRRELHRRLGETIEQVEQVPFAEILASMNTDESSEAASQPPSWNTARVFDLAYHFEAAGERQKDLVYSLLAAESAHRQYALDVALDRYAIARRLSLDHSPIIRHRVTAGHGSALLLSGKYDEAYARLSEAVSLAPTDALRMSAKVQQAEIIYKTRSLADSIRACEALLQELGMKVRPGRVALICEVLKAALFPVRKARDRSIPAWKLSLAAKVFHRLSFPCAFHAPLKCLWAGYRAHELARLSSDALLQCLSGTMKGLAVAYFLAQKRTALSIFADALGIARQLNDTTLEAEVLFMTGNAVLSFGDLEKAFDYYSKSMELNKRIGDAWRVTYVQYMVSIVYARSGNSAASVRSAKQAFESALRFSQHRLAHSVLAPWAMATRGSLPYDQLRARIPAEPEEFQAAVAACLAENEWHTCHHRTDEALQAAEKAVTLLNQYWPVRGCVWPTVGSHSCLAYPSLARALRMHADAIQHSDPVESFRLRKRGLREARRAVRIQSVVRLDRPYAFREMGLACAALGQTKRGYRWALKSHRLAVNTGALYQSLLSLLVCGQLGSKLGLPAAEAQIREAENQLTDFEKPMHEATAGGVNADGVNADGVTEQLRASDTIPMASEQTSGHLSHRVL
ncbi:MAG: protein kinase [Fuerstiella sp.]